MFKYLIDFTFWILDLIDLVGVLGVVGRWYWWGLEIRFKNLKRKIIAFVVYFMYLVRKVK